MIKFIMFVVCFICIFRDAILYSRDTLSLYEVYDALFYKKR